MGDSKHITPGTLSRTVAGFIGLLTGLNLAMRLGGGADLNLWWIDLRAWPSWGAGGLLASLSVAWFAMALFPRISSARRWTTLALSGLAMFVVASNAVWVFQLHRTGVITGRIVLPFSLFVLVVLALIASGLIWPRSPAKARYRKWLGTLTLGCLALLLPLGQMLCFGLTDYRRRADAAVIMGAGVSKAGRVSHVLHYRLATGVELYTKGYVDALVMSGGPGPGATHEVDAMKLWAMSKGVPIEAIHLDYDGVNTKHTAKNVSAMLPKCRLLVVSHGYHLPRVKMAFAAEGVDVCTVPCAEPYVLANMPKYLLREAAALWVYYLF